MDLILFALTYLGLAVGKIPYTKVDRATIALVGAIALVLLHQLDPAHHAGIGFENAVRPAVIDYATLALLFSLMTVSAQLRLAGFYDWVVRGIVASAHKPWTLLLTIMAAGAGLSAVFANDIVCLAFTPVLCVGLKRAGRNPIPYLIALATSSNIGSAATLIGNPQNILIGQFARLSFGHYLLVAGPLALICLALNMGVVAGVYRKDLFADSNGGDTTAPDDGQPIDRPLMIKTLLVTAALLVAFVAGFPRELAGLVAAALMLISRRTEPKKLFELVDWDLILLFVGLFVVIADIQLPEHNLLKPAMGALADRGINLAHPAWFSAVTVTLSNLVSNVPAVLLLAPGIGHQDTARWYLLAVVSTFAGNLTLLGSIANLIVVEGARPFGVEITFREYLKVGVPLTVATCALAVGYLSFV